MTFTATYSPDDNKLRLYASRRLDAETYARAKAVGLRWAPKQDLFFTTWAPGAEDLLIELAGEIDDEDKSLVERAEERADRFDDYRTKRTAEADRAHKAVAAIADGIPLGQPILVGHHSERRARKDAERITDGMRRAVRLWETAEYWKSRARGALFHAKYKELPSVRARRIKTLEAEKRKVERQTADANKFLFMWRHLDDAGRFKRKDGAETTARERAMFIANYDHVSRCFPLSDYPRDPPASQYEGQMALWSALDGNVITAEQARDLAIPVHEAGNARRARWIAHYENRLAYERAMLGEAGGTVADKTGPEKGGAVRCWASPRGGWSYIQKVNKVSVTVLDNWGNGGASFRRNIELDKLQGVMTRAQVDAARIEGRLREDADLTGFFLLDAPPEPAPEIKIGPKLADGTDLEEAARIARFRQMEEQLRNGGVKAVAAPQLFPTPPELAERVIAAAEIRPGDRVLEPSAGTGALLAALDPDTVGEIVAVENHSALCHALRDRFPHVDVYFLDFLTIGLPDGHSLGPKGLFDRIVMNPPFADQHDIRHVMHAMTFLKPSGRLVAIMAAGVTFRDDRLAREFRAMVNEHGGTIEALPDDAFQASGTAVRTVLVTISGPDHVPF